MKKKTLKINKKTISSILNDEELQGIKGGGPFSIGRCSTSLCVSGRCNSDAIGFTIGSHQCC